MPKNIIQMPWKELGTLTKTASNNDAAFTVSERTYKTAYALRATNCVIWYPAPLHLDYLEFRFRGKTDNEDHNIIVWAGRLCGADDCDLTKYADLVVQIGLQVAKNSPTNYTLFADEIGFSNEAWYDTDGGVYQSSDGGDYLARLVIPPCGYDLWVFQGINTFANALKIDGSGFS